MAGGGGGKPFSAVVADNVVVWMLGLLITGFIAGVATYDYALQFFNLKRVSADLECVSKDRMETLTEDERELKQRTARPSQPAKGSNTSEPEYMRGVEDFLHFSPPDYRQWEADYQWVGYGSDIDQLKHIIDGFLGYQLNHDENYDQAHAFYDAMGEAATIVNLHAQETFSPEKESPVTPCGAPLTPVGCFDLHWPNYNQKVYVGPGRFQALVELLRQDHERGKLTHPLIQHYLDQFQDWRSHAGI